MTRKIKILFIGDNLIMVKFLQESLSTVDYEVTTTQYIGQELETVLKETLPQLIILDIMMPGLDGIEVCLRLREWCDIPIMMLTTWGAGANKIRGLDLNADSYLTEPFDADALRTRIKNLFRRNFLALSRRLTIHSGALTLINSPNN